MFTLKTSFLRLPIAAVGYLMISACGVFGEDAGVANHKADGDDITSYETVPKITTVIKYKEVRQRVPAYVGWEVISEDLRIPKFYLHRDQEELFDDTIPLPSEASHSDVWGERGLYIAYPLSGAATVAKRFEGNNKNTKASEDGSSSSWHLWAESKQWSVESFSLRVDGPQQETTGGGMMGTAGVYSTSYDPYDGAESYGSDSEYSGYFNGSFLDGAGSISGGGRGSGTNWWKSEQWGREASGYILSTTNYSDPSGPDFDGETISEGIRTELHDTGVSLPHQFHETKPATSIAGPLSSFAFEAGWTSDAGAEAKWVNSSQFQAYLKEWGPEIPPPTTPLPMMSLSDGSTPERTRRIQEFYVDLSNPYTSADAILVGGFSLPDFSLEPDSGWETFERKSGGVFGSIMGGQLAHRFNGEYNSKAWNESWEFGRELSGGPLATSSIYYNFDADGYILHIGESEYVMKSNDCPPMTYNYLLVWTPIDDPTTLANEGPGGNGEVVLVSKSFQAGEERESQEERLNPAAQGKLGSWTTVEYSIIPADAATTTVDETKIHFTAWFADADPSGESNPNEHAWVEGGTIEWEVVSGGAVLDHKTTTIENGHSTVGVNIVSVPAGSTIVVRNRLKKLSPEGREIKSDWTKSGGVAVLPGHPARVTVTKDKGVLHNDGREEMQLEATVYDAENNLVVDGTSLDWAALAADANFVSKETQTTGGKAKATLRAPVFSRSVKLAVTSGSASHNETIPVSVLAGNLTSSSASLNLSTSAQATLTLQVNAVDGTPVYWFASNGTIGRVSTVQSGTATTSLSTAGGQLGSVVASATVGGKIFTWEGTFTSTTGLFIGLRDKVLVRDVPGEGLTTVTPADGNRAARTVAYHSRTTLFGRGTPNSQIKISVSGFPPGSSGAAALAKSLSVTNQLDSGEEQPLYLSNGQVIFYVNQTGRFWLHWDPPMILEELVGPVLLTIDAEEIGGTDKHSISVPYPKFREYNEYVKVVDSQLNTEPLPLAVPPAPAEPPPSGSPVMSQAAELAKDLFLGDIMDGLTVIDNLAKFTGIKEGEPNWSETALAAGSIALNFVPGGFLAKKALTAATKVVAKLGKNSKFGEIIYRRAIDAIKKDRDNLTDYVDSGELNFVEKISDDDALLPKLNSANASDAYVDALRRLDKEIGDPVWDKVKTMNATPEEIQEVLTTIGEASDEAMTVLKGGGMQSGNDIASTIEGVHVALKSGRTPATLKGVLNNAEIDVPSKSTMQITYNRVDLLSDLGKPDAHGIKLGAVKGVNDALIKLADPKNGGPGLKYEFQVAGYLRSQGCAIEYIGESIPLNKLSYEWKGGVVGKFNKKWTTDVDVNVVRGNERFLFQVKSSEWALNENPRTLSNWIGAAQLRNGKDGFKIGVPSGANPSAETLNVIKKFEDTAGNKLEWDNIREFCPAPEVPKIP